MSIVSKMEKTRAKRIGSVSPSHKALLGQYLTPIEVAHFMAKKLIQFGPQREKVSLLDPGAGTGTLFCSFLEQAATSNDVSEISVDAYEIDETIVPHLQDVSESVYDEPRFSDSWKAV
jgi:adenine-specific DNA-methyltransferase